MRKRSLVLSILVLILSACGSAPSTPYTVGKSLYLNRKLTKFELDNGYCYRRVPLKNGHTLNYWRSDTGRLIAVAMGRDDNYPDYCEVALETDGKGIVRRIYMVEESVACIGVLK